MRKFILGTDWWTDCDDAVAVRVLAKAHKAGEIELLGIGINACMEHSAASLSAFLTFHNVDVPIGIDLNATDYTGKLSYQEMLSEYPHKLKSNYDADDAVKLYRRILANSDAPVEIIEIGFLQVISGVLESTGDEISDKSGCELFKEKVAKVWVMAGKWDEESGVEHNFAVAPRARKAANLFCEKCPCPVTFLGYEIGYDILTGGNLDKNDILGKVLRKHGSENGRCSWDPMLVYLAICGDEKEAGYDTVCGKATVNPETGENTFIPCPDGPHKYVVKNKDNEYYKKIINDIIEMKGLK